jgi:hypothetical protein
MGLRAQGSATAKLAAYTGCTVEAQGMAGNPLITPALFSHRPPPNREKRERFV